MWPFRKKRPSQETVSKTYQTVICIPGNWDSWDEFILAIVAASDGEYLAVGNFLMNSKKQRHYTIEFCERDEKIKESFKYAGMVTRVSEAFLDSIGDHRNVIYLYGPTGNLEDAREIALAAEAVLKAGGLGIKIESTGKAFEKDVWRQLLFPSVEANLYQMFVVDSIVNENGEVYSCGMQNLGFKDTIVSGMEFQEAVDLITIFGYYQIVDKPVIKHKQTFSLSNDAPRFRITEEIDQPYKGDALFENPFGMWRLSKA